MSNDIERGYFSERDCFLMKEAFNAGHHYASLGEWLEDVIDDQGHVVAQHLAHDADRKQPAQGGDVEPVAFGSGDKVVEVGAYGGRPAVFVAPANPSGAPGELAPPTTGEDKHRLVAGEWLMTFPTDEQAYEVADALCGRPLKRLDGQPPEISDHAKATAHQLREIANSLCKGYAVEPSDTEAVKAMDDAAKLLAHPAPTGGSGEAVEVPNEHGKNRYGLDMAYFRSLFNRELNRPLVDFRPDELARVLARAARTADASVLQGNEFQPAPTGGTVPEDVKQKAFECLFDNASYDWSCDECELAIDLLHGRGMLAAAPTTPPGADWVRCEDRLPSHKDADDLGNVWISTKGLGIVPLHKDSFNEPPFYTHWKPTGLTRPQPPREQEAGSHE